MKKLSDLKKIPKLNWATWFKTHYHSGPANGRLWTGSGPVICGSVFFSKSDSFTFKIAFRFLIEIQLEKSIQFWSRKNVKHPKWNIFCISENETDFIFQPWSIRMLSEILESFDSRIWRCKQERDWQTIFLLTGNVKLRIRWIPNRPLIIAHRGASGDRPAHSVEAYQLAIEHGRFFKYLES